MTFEKITERCLNLTSILKNFISFIRQVYQKESTQNIDKKKHQNNYFREEKTKRRKKYLHFKKKSQIDF